MEQWNFYMSGILYGICERTEDRICHRPLDVHTGLFEDWRELTADETWYLELGKMNVRNLLLKLSDYVDGVKEVLNELSNPKIKEGREEAAPRFTTPSGEIYKRRDTDSFVQRNVKFPSDLITEDENVVAFVTPFRDQCAVLVKEGFEERTVLRYWKEINETPLFTVKPPVTEMVSMRDHVRLATDIYLPEGAGKVPAVLVRTPYGKNIGTASYFRFVQRGYAVVIQDVRGREDSEGEWLPMYYEVEDGDDTLNWIVSQPWSDGGVCMTGGSYLGYVQWAAAASGNPHLKAMLSNVYAGSPFVDVPRRGGCFNSGILAWAFLVSGQHADPELMARDDWDDVLAIRPLEELAPKALGYDIPFLKKWLTHMDYDELWQRGNWKDRTGANRVPALIMSGWFDDNGMGTTEALELYQDYPEKKVILGPWLHSGNASYDLNGLALGSNALRYGMDFICLSWLEHYLKGVDNGIDQTPKVEYYTCGSNQWKTADNWPVPGTKELIYYFDGSCEDAAASNNGLLTTEPPLHASSDSYRYNPEDPAHHLIDMSENELEVPADYAEEERRPDALCYTNGRLTSDLTITDDATAELFLFSDCEDTDLVVRITDVDEEGRSMKLADRVLSVRYRNQFDHPDFMEPDTVYPVKIRTTKISHTILKGHRLRVTVTSSAENFIFPNRGTRDGFNSVTIRTANNCIHRGGSCASRVLMRMERDR